MRGFGVMTRLARIAPLRAHGERGAVATIVAVLLGGGVLFGCAALSIDVGSIMFERRQLQNGADASAIALGRACTKGTAACGASTGTPSGTITNTTLTRLNNVNNTKDQLGGFDPSYPAAAGSLPGLCASATTWGLPACPATTDSVTDCGPVPAGITSVGAPYVEVHTITKQSGSSPTILPNAISRLIVGGNAGESVKACARAAWGPPSTGHAGMPITISGCDWRGATGGTLGGGGGTYWPQPVYSASYPYGYGGATNPWPAPALTPPAMNTGNEVILMVQNPSGGGSHVVDASCPNWQGHALPGGFGLLETQPTDPCAVLDYTNNWVHTNPGSSTTCDLNSFVGKLISLPIYDCTASSLPVSSAIPPPGGDCTQGSGSNAWYHRQGYALFYLSGYNITTTSGTPNHHKSIVPANNNYPCGGGDSCISGWFVSGELTASALAGPPGGPDDFGSFAVVPAG